MKKHEPKAWVSCLYESTEFAFRLLNHLIPAGPKMLHGVCIVVVNGEGWLLESSGESAAPLIRHVNGDLESWSRALLMASCPKPLGDGLLRLRLRSEERRVGKEC